MEPASLLRVLSRLDVALCNKSHRSALLFLLKQPYLFSQEVEASPTRDAQQLVRWLHARQVPVQSLCAQLSYPFSKRVDNISLPFVKHLTIHCDSLSSRGQYSQEFSTAAAAAATGANSMLGCFPNLTSIKDATTCTERSGVIWKTFHRRRDLILWSKMKKLEIFSKIQEYDEGPVLDVIKLTQIEELRLAFWSLGLAFALTQQPMLRVLEMGEVDPAALRQIAKLLALCPRLEALSFALEEDFEEADLLNVLVAGKAQLKTFSLRLDSDTVSKVTLFTKLCEELPWLQSITVFPCTLNKISGELDVHACIRLKQLQRVLGVSHNITTTYIRRM